MVAMPSTKIWKVGTTKSAGVGILFQKKGSSEEKEGGKKGLSEPGNLGGDDKP